jgi:hypothetical protein
MKGHDHKASRKLDRMGIVVSAVCLVHCLALPVVAMALPLVDLGRVDGLFHVLLLAVIVPVAIVAFAVGYAKHGSPIPLLLGALGIVSVVLSVACEDLLPEAAGHALTVLGSVVLISGHVMNIRTPCPSCEEE